METIYLVVAAFRSGSSGLMDAFVAGGMETLVDKQRERFNGVADDGFKLNPGPLYEVSREDLQEPEFFSRASGKVVKVLFSLLEDLQPVAAGYEYLGLLLLRDPEELRQEQEAAQIQIQTEQWFDERQKWAERTLKARTDITSLHVMSYNDFVFDPRPDLLAFRAQGWPLDVDKAAAVIDPKFYRMRNSDVKTRTFPRGVPEHPDHPFLIRGL